MVSMQKNVMINLPHGYCGFIVPANQLALRGMTGSGAR